MKHFSVWFSLTALFASCCVVAWAIYAAADTAL